MYKVFIVDDEPFIVEGLYDIVDWEAMGLEIVGSAENGKAALEAIRTTPVDIMITDISMPIMDGLTLIRQARELLLTDLKIIVLSGFNEFDYLKEGMRLGIENYLLKPINLEELKATLANTLAKLNASRASDSFHEQSMRILKDNVMYRWLMKQIEPEPFRERAALLGIELDAPYAAVAVLRQERERKEVADFIARQQEHNSGAVSFRDMDGDIVIVFKMDEPAAGMQEAEAILLSYMRLLEEYGRLRVTLGSAEQLEEASESYAQARKAQEYFLIYEDRSMIRYDDLPSGNGDDRLRFPLDWQDYRRMVMAKDRESLMSRIDEDFAQLQRAEGIAPGDLQDTAIEAIVRFKMLLKEIRHDEEPELYTGSFGRLKGAERIDDLVRIVQEAAGITVDALIKDVKSPVVQQVLNHIHESYNEDLSLKTLGSLYNIHPVYLGQLFHKECNESFTEYMNKFRVEKAKEQLKNTQLKVHEIARNVGYWETGYFYKQFKKHVGISPTEFKGLL
ncbi:response regulator transcription factor [Paenibacillus arenilitoris]|uniref:Response regulator transcription factor n=1 Tax=Paenibacillus arenilitoris TaxID=2772299 RepID=A0A927CP35_9BACL|nr:response regulator transcription factor [Paenibacillus arenilitoris]MBD2870882.1 response regulator transcription factor [Paenibacillus arenilitoris]